MALTYEKGSWPKQVRQTQATEMQSQARSYMVQEQALPDSDRIRSRIIQIRSHQEEQGGEACFLTNKRLLCENFACEWRKECYRLVAA